MYCFCVYRGIYTAVVLWGSEVQYNGCHKDPDKPHCWRSCQFQFSQDRDDERRGRKENILSQTETPRHEHSPPSGFWTPRVFNSLKLPRLLYTRYSTNWQICHLPFYGLLWITITTHKRIRFLCHFNRIFPFKLDETLVSTLVPSITDSCFLFASPAKIEHFFFLNILNLLVYPMTDCFWLLWFKFTTLELQWKYA